MLGYTLPGESKQARAEMGVVPQLDNLDVELTLPPDPDGLRAALPRADGRARRRRCERALSIANLTERADTRVDLLSGGMRRRLLIARGLVHRPRLVLLDEPTVGLDPQVRQELWSLIDALRAEGTTVLMSTHYIEEAERLADTVAVMARGQIVARGKPARARARARRPRRRTRSTARRRGSRSCARRRERRGLDDAPLRARRWRSCTPSATTATLPEGVRRAATLEDAFVVLTGEEIE